MANSDGIQIETNLKKYHLSSLQYVFSSFVRKYTKLGLICYKKDLVYYSSLTNDKGTSI